jgi:peptide/nickel transport system substrate-binding protein
VFLSAFLRRFLAAATVALTFTVAAAAAPLNVGATFITSGLDPTKGSNGWALVSHGIGETLFTVDRQGGLIPELAEGTERIGTLLWRVRLQPGRFFADGAPVTARLVTEAFAHTVAFSKTAQATGGKLGFAVEDERTLVVTTQRPVPVIEALFAEWPLIVYHLGKDGAASFSGPYEVAEFNPDLSLRLDPNPHYAGAERRSEVVWRKFGDGQALALAFEAGGLDLAFGLPAESIDRLKAVRGITVKSFRVGYHYFAIFNTKRANLGDVRVRRALDLIFDRTELAEAIEAGAPATGAYAPYFPFSPHDPRPTDRIAAAKLLDEAGWVRGADGLRAKGGQTLKLVVLAYPQRPDLVTIQPVMKSELAKEGVVAETRLVESANEAAASGDFDILLWAQHTAPSGDPAFFLNSSFRTGAGLNFSGYASPEFDALLDRLAIADKPAKRDEIAIEAQQRLFRDVPVSFLIAPEWFVGLSERLKDYEPWGSDYHVLRADIGETR